MAGYPAADRTAAPAVAGIAIRIAVVDAAVTVVVVVAGCVAGRLSAPSGDTEEQHDCKSAADHEGTFTHGMDFRMWSER